MNPGIAATSAAAIPRSPSRPPVVHHPGRSASRPARSNRNAPYRKANGKGISAGWIGWPRKLARLLIASSLLCCWLAELLLNLLGPVEVFLYHRLGLFDQLLELLILRGVVSLARQIEHRLVNPDLLLDVG